MSKLSLEAIKIEVNLRGWVLLSTIYKNLDGELEFLCPEGHKNFMSLKQWRKKQECPTCAANVFKTIKNEKPISKGNGIIRVLAIDDSTTITGWAIFDNQVLVSYGKIQMTQNTPVARISGIKQWMYSMIQKWDPDIVAIEDIQQQSNAQVFKILAQLQGVLENSLYEKELEYYIVHTATWRSYCGVKGKNRTELKANAQKQVKMIYDITVTEDEADAICIGRYTASTVKNQDDFISWD